MRKLHSLCVSCLSLALFTPVHAGATSIVAADDGGYAGNVIEKVGNEWTPPPGLRGTFSVRIKVTVGEDGKVRSCKPTEPSAIKALDDAACGAVYKAAPFGKTPDGKPVDVHMAFRIGTPKKAPREPSFEEAAIETMKERERLNNQMANEKASYQSSRAKEQAEALAQKMGKELPDLHMPPLEVSKPVPVPSPLARNRKDASSNADRKTQPDQGKQAQARQKVESSGVPMTAAKTGDAPELVIKSNLKNLDAALEAQSEATAEAQASQSPSANSPITFVNRPSGSEAPASPVTPSATGKAAVPPQAKTVATSLTQDELAVPPLEHLKAEVILLPAPTATETAPAPEANRPEPEKVPAVQEPVKQEPAKAAPPTPEQPKAEQAKSDPAPAKETKSAATAGDTKPEPATAPVREKSRPVTDAETPKASPTTGDKAATTASEKLQEVQKAQAPAPVPADMSYADYLDRLKQDIQKKIKLPSKLPQGRYIVSVQLYLGRKGGIQRADLIHNSSNVKRDEALAEAVRLVDRVTPPPAALGRSFPLTLVFDVQ